MTAKLVIPFALSGLNEYVGANRANRYSGAKEKKRDTERLALLIRSQLRGVRFENPVRISYLWVERSRRRDKDNIAAYGMKVIQDALVAAGVLENDGWKHVAGFSHEFAVGETPRVEVTIEECAV